MTAETISVEVVFALPDRQELLDVVVPKGSSVADAIAASGIAGLFPDTDLVSLPTGIWGREVPRSALPRDGDRIEIYRPLEMDPKEARRQLAAAGRTMVDRRRPE